jgi:hypothetical protein
MNKLYLLQSLEVLGKVESGQKLRLNYGKLEIDKTPNALLRWFSGNNKHVSLEYLVELINTAIYLYVPIEHNVVTALENLKTTYRMNETMVFRLASLQELIARTQ